MDRTTHPTESAIYTVRVGSGRECYLCVPENDGHLTLTDARAVATRLRERGYRGVYIVDHMTGDTQR